MPVFAAADGKVMLARPWKSCPNWGYILVIDHTLADGSHVSSIYGHLDASTVVVTEGQSIVAGSMLGRTGAYHCWKEHLHFAIHIGPYDAQVGVYPNWLNGYLAPNLFPASYVNPSDFVAAHGPGLLGTDLPHNSGAEIAVISSQFVAQEFTLTQPIHITSINLQMSGFGNDQFTFWLTNSIGPSTTTSNVLLQRNLTFPNTGGGVNGTTVSVSTDMQLDPGAYFLVLSSEQTSIFQGWLLATMILPSNVGTVTNHFLTTFASLGGNTNSQFPPGSSFVAGPVLLNPFAFQIDGSQLIFLVRGDPEFGQDISEMSTREIEF